MTDGELLEAYISRKDEAALAALVQRHGPMVWGVCRRVLGNYHDAEDAFQATFLVLVRRATSVKPRAMVANWLYGVAHQTALKARAMVCTRKGRERQVLDMPEPAVAEPAQWDELLPLLDEELSRLPDNYRAVVVLCDLEGKTRKEASRQLGIPEGTVGGWIARARVLLAKRLTQRGVTLSGGALAAVLSQSVASAGVPATVVSNTIKVASLMAAGQAVTGLIPVKVAALTEGVLRAMFLTKLKTAATCLLLFALICGVAGIMYQTQAAEQPKDEPKPKAANTAVKPPKNLPPVATTNQRQYVVTPKLVEAGAGQPSGTLLPRMTVEDGQPCHVGIDAADRILLTKIGGDDKLKIGTFLDVRVRSLEGNKARLYCSFQKNAVEKFSDSDISVIGNSVQVIRDVEFRKPVKLVLQKDSKGTELCWIEIMVEKSPAERAVNRPRMKADEK